MDRYVLRVNTLLIIVHFFHDSCHTEVVIFTLTDFLFLFEFVLQLFPQLVLESLYIYILADCENIKANVRNISSLEPRVNVSLHHLFEVLFHWSAFTLTKGCKRLIVILLKTNFKVTSLIGFKVLLTEFQLILITISTKEVTFFIH